MKGVYLIAFVTILLQSQSRIICWPLFACAFASKYVTDERKLFGFAFILGILSDLVSGRLLGETAVFLLIFMLIINFLNLRFRASLKMNLSAAIVFEIIYIVLVNNLHF